MISFPDAETIAAADIPALLGAIATYKAQLMVRLLAVPAPGAFRALWLAVTFAFAPRPSRLLCKSLTKLSA
jgi:hypothetical protein